MNFSWVGKRLAPGWPELLRCHGYRKFLRLGFRLVLQADVSKRVHQFTKKKIYENTQIENRQFSSRFVEHIVLLGLLTKDETSETTVCS